MPMFKPRPKQAEVLAYRRGLLGVAAVPGSGKTATLSALAARLLTETELADGQEILVVTLVNSAVANFSRQIKATVQQGNLLPGYGYRVRTLHSLANDIVRQMPSAAGLSEQFSILDERASNEILADAVDAWARRNPDAADAYLGAEYLNNPQIRSTRWTGVLIDTARDFIRQAKDSLLTAAAVAARAESSGGQLPLAAIGSEIYQEYERALAYRGAVDFQDLIRLALQVLQERPDYLASLRQKWVYILEDEAQDSSRLQETILRLLAGAGGNWARVGDPNQAIYESFTTADPKYLRAFIAAPGAQARELPNSGRSMRSIQRLANRLIQWSLAHPNAAIAQRRPLTTPYILPTPAGDPQPNPPDNPDALVLYAEAFSPSREAMLVTESCKRWLAENPRRTAAILVARNGRGSEIVQFLRRKEVPYVENLNSTSTTRAVVGALARLLGFLADPKSAAKLADVYRVWRRDEREIPGREREINAIAERLKRIKRVEDLLAPRLVDWLEEALPADEDAPLRAHLLQFREQAAAWLRAVEMPIDQLLLALTGDIFRNVTDIATAHMVALHLARLAQANPQHRLPQFAAELYGIAQNKIKFAGLTDEESQFDPDAHAGKVTVTTLHKAKGLEWDRVYLISVNNYDFPSAEPDDTFIGERWFLRDRLNLSAEARAQLEALRSDGAYAEGAASAAARIEYAAERLRLLYVGITRARRALTITWNTGRNGDAREATPLLALRAWWESERAKGADHAPGR